MAVLILNGGSTGWKIAVYDDLAIDATPFAEARAETNAKAEPAAFVAACDAFEQRGLLDDLHAVGHRIVHGGERFTASVRIDDDVEAALRSFAALAPSHAPLELAGIDAARRRFPNVPQIAVFDTAFHRTLPETAFTYPGPYAWRERGIRRFGFHGTSVGYCVERAAQFLQRAPHEMHLIVAHLGGGCSVTAVRAGESVDTSMGFTPLDGTMMGTRSGAIDPGIITYLARERATPNLSAAQFADDLDAILNHQSGLLGISGISGDVREIEAAAHGNARAALALDLFAHRAATTIAGMSASLDRIDTLVFTGGIGEHAAPMRARICERLRALGVSLDASANAAVDESDRRVERSGPAILVITTREEWFAARECARVTARS